MTEVTILELIKHALTVGISVSAPLLIASLVVGAVIGILMAATQIQEFTLTFVPKLLALAAILLIVGPWMLRSLTAFGVMIFQKLPSVAP
ncbi:MAG: Flagellar biosynthetic protein FliQ [bacterium ADurb.Bin429]|nr:MAG: Flagellar biosynthetic protein FliQ [bacterium ADurb.Bin429]